MEYTHLLLRYGEIFLKGKNQKFFVRKLVQNVKSITNLRDVTPTRGRIICSYNENHASLRNVFGLLSYSPCIKIEKDIEKMKEVGLNLLKDRKGSFRVTTKRSDKTFSIKSQEVSREVGGFLEENTKLEFSLTEPEIILHIEINQEGVYMFVDSIPCFGGLPTGVEGKVFLLVESEASLLAGLLIMRRGVDVFPVAFKEKDVSLLQKYSPVPLTMKTFASLQEVETFAKEKNIDILINGECLDNYEKSNTSLLTLRPLIHLDEKMIQQKLTEFI